MSLLANDPNTDELLKFRYPIGKFDRSQPITESSLKSAIQEIHDLPATLRAAVVTLGEEELDTPYRPGGWTVRQLIHHIADSHINAYIRLKLALTEENPTIKPYEEQVWAELPEARNGAMEVSLNLLDALHERFTLTLQSLTPDQWKRTYLHPESGRTSVETLAHTYSWHGKHHVAHITNLRERMEW